MRLDNVLLLCNFAAAAVPYPHWVSVGLHIFIPSFRSCALSLTLILPPRILHGSHLALLRNSSLSTLLRSHDPLDMIDLLRGLDSAEHGPMQEVTRRQCTRQNQGVHYVSAALRFLHMEHEKNEKFRVVEGFRYNIPQSKLAVAANRLN